jgi:hypothetical protein
VAQVRKVAVQMVLVTSLKVVAAAAQEVMREQEDKVNLGRLHRLTILRVQAVAEAAAVVAMAVVSVAAVLVYLVKELAVTQE